MSPQVQWRRTASERTAQIYLPYANRMVLKELTVVWNQKLGLVISDRRDHDIWCQQRAVVFSTPNSIRLLVVENISVMRFPVSRYPAVKPQQTTPTILSSEGETGAQEVLEYNPAAATHACSSLWFRTCRMLETSGYVITICIKFGWHCADCSFGRKTWPCACARITY